MRATLAAAALAVAMLASTLPPQDVQPTGVPTFLIQRSTFCLQPALLLWQAYILIHVIAALYERLPTYSATGTNRQSVTLKCNTGSSVSNEVDWYQLKEGETPKLLIGYTFGQGTRIIVKSRALASPVVSLLPPPTEELAKNRAALVCLVDKFHPDIVEVVWKIDDKGQTDGVLKSKSLKASDNTYSMSSILTLTRAKWESGEKYSCTVKHENSATPIENTINRSQCTTV
ncbi:immunoglobulin lambda-1 light chain-like [Polyodon spathula]|uniref:immunoglobulin lambda-1 light chain-like n=1 Tax=Polyodon spathula TaxID=7913 RepID=UPI001B7E0906|nr:immunoglobulin lambda-1 light chain-like [Polyodon spathula]